LIPGSGLRVGAFFLRQHFVSVPHEVRDVARVDSAGQWRVLCGARAHVTVDWPREGGTAHGGPALERLSLASGHHQLHRLSTAIGRNCAALPGGSGTVGRVVMAGTLFVALPVVVLLLAGSASCGRRHRRRRAQRLKGERMQRLSRRYFLAGLLPTARRPGRAPVNRPRRPDRSRRPRRPR
jgi:hypothetical protein